jgi:opacity protein-like surface antigen
MTTGNTICRRLFCAAVIVATAAAPARAADVGDVSASAQSGWYYRGGAGASFVQNTRISLDFSQADAGVQFDPGFSVQAVGGYRFCPCFGLEAETGLADNLIHSITGSPSTRAEFSQIPVMFNAAFQWPCCAHVIPYAGFGLGLTADYINIDHATVQGVNVSGDRTAVTFAGQAFAGVRFPINDRAGVDLGYKYMATSRPEWGLTSFNPARTSGTLVLREPQTHFLLLEFQVTF